MYYEVETIPPVNAFVQLNKYCSKTLFNVDCRWLNFRIKQLLNSVFTISISKYHHVSLADTPSIVIRKPLPCSMPLFMLLSIRFGSANGADSHGDHKKSGMFVLAVGLMAYSNILRKKKWSWSQQTNNEPLWRFIRASSGHSKK